MKNILECCSLILSFCFGIVFLSLALYYMVIESEPIHWSFIIPVGLVLGIQLIAWSIIIVYKRHMKSLPFTDVGVIQ